MTISEPKKVLRYSIFVGMRDMNTLEQEISTKKILSITDLCLQNYGLTYSYHLQTGAYRMENSGDYIKENSLCITLIDADEAIIRELAGDICCFINQESVMITIDEVQVCFLSDNLAGEKI